MKNYEVKLITVEKVEEKDLAKLLSAIYEAAESILGKDKVAITAKTKGSKGNGKE